MIKTGSVLEKLQRAVDKHRNRVAKATERVETLRHQYSVAHWSQKNAIAGKGFRAKQVLNKAEGDLMAAELALHEEEKRLLQPDTFLRFA